MRLNYGQVMSQDALSIEDALLDATEAAIAEHGIARVSLERIGEHAGLSRATIYRRGVTVETLLNAAIGGAMASFRASVWGYVPLRRSHDWPVERARDAVRELALGGVLKPEVEGSE